MLQPFKSLSIMNTARMNSIPKEGTDMQSIYNYRYKPCSVKRELNSLPNNKFLGKSKLKAFADENKNVTEN